MKDNESNQTPKIDMMQTALDHYEEAAAAINHWMSDIPEAIKQYYATPEAKECDDDKPIPINNLQVK